MYVLFTVWACPIFIHIFMFIYVHFSLTIGVFSMANKPLLGNWLPPFPKGIDFVTILLFLLRRADRLIMIHYEINASWVNISSTWIKKVMCLHIFIRNHYLLILRNLYNPGPRFNKQEKLNSQNPLEKPWTFKYNFLLKYFTLPEESELPWKGFHARNTAIKIQQLKCQ